MELESLIAQSAPCSSGRSEIELSHHDDLSMWFAQNLPGKVSIYMDASVSTTRLNLTPDECEALACKLIAQARDVRAQQAQAAA